MSAARADNTVKRRNAVFEPSSGIFRHLYSLKSVTRVEEKQETKSVCSLEHKHLSASSAGAAAGVTARMGDESGG